jgi:hypothetical protein
MGARTMLRNLTMLFCLLALAGCNLTPAQLGITGPATRTPPDQSDDSVVATPGAQTGDSPYTPTTTPSTGGGRFFGYN